MHAWVTFSRTLLSIGFALLPGNRLCAQYVLPADAGSMVNGFQDGFSGSALGTNWVVCGASDFYVSGGALHVVTGGGSLSHLLYALPGYNHTVQEILARIRVLDFPSGGGYCGGLAVGVNPATCEGIDYAFRNGPSEGQSGNYLGFMDDFAGWGPGQEFGWQMYQWYWLRLHLEPNATSQGGANDVFAKAWAADGNTPEPPGWQLTWDYTPAINPSPCAGFAGIAVLSGAVAQFDVDYILIKAGGLPVIQVSPGTPASGGAAAPSFPAGESTVPALRTIEVHFNQPVTGVAASNLLINYVPATNVTAYAPWQYVFDFPEPALGIVHVSWAADANIRSLANQSNVVPGGGWSYTLNRLAPPPSLQISEFMASNKNTLLDEDGDSSDWIEIYNGTPSAVDLAGWFLTTEATNLTQWGFPDYVLASGDYLVVFASGKNRAAVTGELHTNFKLPSAGGFLALVDPQANLVSAFTYPPQQTDISYGVDPVLLNAVGYYTTPTPGNANDPVGNGFTAEPAFSQPGGTFLNPFSLRVSDRTPNAVIRYTVNGTVPTDASPVLAGPLAVTNSVQVRARAFAPGLLPGPMHSESYMQITKAVANITSDLPAVIIYNFGAGAVPIDSGDPEQFANFSFYEPVNGQTSLTNAPTLSSRGGFHVRGSSTRYLPKQAWAVKFWDELNNGTDCSPLELPPSADWVFYAPDSFEPVLIHNPLIYQLSNEIGRYAPRTRLMEVYISTSGGPVTPADYNGIYVLTEKVERGANRVDINKLQPDESIAPAVTGGYMLSINRLEPGEHGFNTAGLALLYADPGEADITTPERAPQSQYIKNYINTFGAALNAANYTDPVLGYAAYIDVDSCIDYHILNVVPFNVDAMVLSTYFYKPRQGKLFFGPIWDYDRAQGSTDGRDFNPFCWFDSNTTYGATFYFPWWQQMFTDMDFWQKWIDRYEDLRTGLLSTNHIYADIDALTAQVRREQPREAARWPGYTTPRSGTVSVLGYSYRFPGTYQGEVDFLKQWYRDRLNFIDTNLLAKPVFSSVGGPVSSGQPLAISGPAGAVIYYCTNGSDPRLPGGAASPKALIYHSPITPDSGTVIMARSYDPNYHSLTGSKGPPLSSPWSGFTTASLGLVTSPAQLVYGGAGSVYIQNFDSLPNPGTNSVDAANPAAINGVTYSLANPIGLGLPVQGPGGVGGLGLSNTMPGWFGLASLTSKLGASEGDQSTGGIISFGLTNSPSASANRALGLLATSSTGPTAFGLCLVNGTGSILNQMTLSFTGELWRQSAVAKQLSFGYLIDLTGTNGFPTNLTASLPVLDVSFPTASEDKIPVPVDGTASASQVSLSVTGQAITNWPPGAALWLVWSMADTSSKGQGLAIDNLAFSASASGQPGLAIQQTGTNLILFWPSGQLQSSSNVSGPFLPVTNVASPFTSTPTGACQFYRVVEP
ncbi:MAG: CotH kinase family protein [Limisphaerales bacterium]